MLSQRDLRICQNLSLLATAHEYETSSFRDTTRTPLKFNL